MIPNGYKETEIGVIPLDWEVVRLKDTTLTIIDGDRGKNYPKSDDFKDEGFCLFLSAKNITKNGFKLNAKQFISEEKDNLLRKGKLKDLDIIITTRGSVGHIAYNKDIEYKDMRINSGMVILRNSDENIYQEYIYKLFTSNTIQGQIEKITFGSAQPQLTVKEINNLKIPLPPLTQQKKIAKILSTTDNKIEAITKQIEKAEMVKKGLMQRLLSEEMEQYSYIKLENLVDIVSGQSPSKFDLTGSKYKFFKVNQLNFCEKYLINSEYAFDCEYNNILEKGTIIFPKRGASIFTNKVRILTQKSFIDTNLMGLIVKSNLNNIFLYYWLVKFELSNIADTSSIPQINNKHINPLKISLPPLKQQQKIANILSKSDQKIEILKAKKEQYQALKKGLMQKLLTGEVGV